tara:strand:- start:368 stop:1327 length:960 start_codon:yes stop_codon:yes gene_type:complete
MDYYKVLGVKEDSDQNEIKKAYRKLSLKYHPDKATGDAEKFKEINEAFQHLGDTEKRSQYDFMKKNKRMGGNGMPPGMQFPGGLNEVFNMFFNEGNINEGMPFMGGPTVFPFPGMQQGQVFVNGRPINPRNLHRMGSFSKTFQKPTPIIKHIDISLEQAYIGLKYPLNIERWIKINDVRKIEKEKVYVDIPQGVDDNEMIILKEQGNELGGVMKGDIKVFIRIKNDTNFVREGLHLRYKNKISLKDALTGFKHDIKHLNGKTYTINNENSLVVQPNSSTVIENMGMKRGEHIGNLIIQFEVEFPRKLTDEQKEKIKEIL